MLLSGLVLRASPAAAQATADACAPPAVDAATPQTVDVGTTGFAVKRPVLASACPHGCPWGELGDFLTEAMQPFGYEVIQCRNCNLSNGPRIVANASYPPELGITDTFVGTTTRVNAPIDFGITSSALLSWAFDGIQSYAGEPYPKLRLIAKVEDPSYLLVAVKMDSCITDLSQIAAQKLPVQILGGGSPISQPVLDYYGLTQSAVTSWGGAFENATIVGQSDDPPFDVAITENASPAQNPESAYWTKISQKHDLRFLDLPETVLDQLANDKTLGVQRVTVKWGLLRGVDRPISTVARSGHVVFARDDMPEQAAYDVAKAIDGHRDALKWYIRPYSYDPRTAWADLDVPLHPGAERYYREVGYLAGSGTDGGCPASTPNVTPAPSVGGGCACAAPGPGSGRYSLVVAMVSLLGWRRRRRQTRRLPCAAC
jgi:TRAP transporter TAXI family solute receptor